MDFIRNLVLGNDSDNSDFVTEALTGLTVGENSETAFLLKNKCLDLFGTINRETSVDVLVNKFVAAWNENPELCIKILFNFRDIRNGKGERRISHIMLFLIKVNFPDIYESILPSFVEMGYWKDILCICEISVKYGNLDLSTESRDFAFQLQFDSKSPTPSLCAKWAPTEGSHYDRNGMNMAKNIREYMKLSPKEYRKLLSGIRAKIKLVESQLSQNRLDEINFSTVPSKAHLLYRDAFKCGESNTGANREALAERYRNYLESLASGDNTVKANYKGVMPHEIIKKLGSNSDNALLENQWSSILKEIEDLGIFERCVSIVDVSGSMSGQPMEVAIALGLLISQCAQGPFHDKLITFHDRPKFVSHGKFETLCDKVNHIRGMDWGMSTNLEAVFDQLLEAGRFHNLTADQMPDRLFIFTDMQFDQVSGRRLKTFDKIAEKFEAHGYQMPQVICWNLRTVSAVPFTHNDMGVAMLSGFSTELLKAVMTGDDFTPMSIFLQAVNKYNVPPELEYGIINLEDINIERLSNVVASLDSLVPFF